jgi:hypothetical protein
MTNAYNNGEDKMAIRKMARHNKKTREVRAQRKERMEQQQQPAQSTLLPMPTTPFVGYIFYTRDGRQATVQSFNLTQKAYYGLIEGVEGKACWFETGKHAHETAYDLVKKIKRQERPTVKLKTKAGETSLQVHEPPVVEQKLTPALMLVPGKFYRCRDGKKLVVGFPQNTVQHGAVFSCLREVGEGQHRLGLWAKDGSAVAGDEYTLGSDNSFLDILEPWRNVYQGTLFLNIMANRNHSTTVKVYNNREQADKWKGHKTVAQVEVAWIEGQTFTKR